MSSYAEDMAAQQAQRNADRDTRRAAILYNRLTGARALLADNVYPDASDEARALLTKNYVDGAVKP